MRSLYTNGITLIFSIFRNRFMTEHTRVPLIAANWKMHHTSIDAEAFLQAMQAAQLPDDRDVVICPSYTSLHIFNAADTAFSLGAQNMHAEVEGAFTGEVSATMLVDAGCSYVILGHSERRAQFNETDEQVNAKVVTALHNDLTPIICIGETQEQRAAGNTLEIVKVQVEAALHDLTQDAIDDVVIAYEPLWAIGTGETATAEQAQEVHASIRSIVGEKTRVLYGGSVKPDNIAELMQQPDIDGALVGGASLEAESFLQIVQY